MRLLGRELLRLRQIAGLFQVQRTALQLRLLLELLGAEVHFCQVTGLLEIQRATLELRFLLELLGTKTQLLCIDTQRLQASGLRLGHLCRKLLALGGQSGFLNRQLTALRRGFLLQLLGAEVDFLLLDAQPTQPELAPQLLFGVELPALFRLLLGGQRLRPTDLPRQFSKAELLTQRQFRGRQLALLRRLGGLQRLLALKLKLALPELRRRQPFLKLLGLPHATRLELCQVLCARQFAELLPRLQRREAILCLRLGGLLEQLGINVG